MDQQTKESLAATYVGAVNKLIPAGMEIELPSNAREPKADHKLIIALKCAKFRNGEIAEIIGCSEQHVGNVCNDPDYAWYVQLLGDHVALETLSDARGVIQAHTREAAMALVGLMRGAESEHVRKAAADSILDRGGVPKSEIQQRTNLTLESEDANNIIQALREMQQAVPQVTEVSETHSLITARSQGESYSNGAIQTPDGGAG